MSNLSTTLRGMGHFPLARPFESATTNAGELARGCLYLLLLFFLFRGLCLGIYRRMYHVGGFCCEPVQPLLTYPLLQSTYPPWPRSQGLDSQVRIPPGHVWDELGDDSRHWFSSHALV